MNSFLKNGLYTTLFIRQLSRDHSFLLKQSARQWYFFRRALYENSSPSRFNHLSRLQVGKSQWPSMCFSTQQLNKNNIVITERVVNRLFDIMADEGQDTFLRVSVESGGCHGFSYKFSLDTKIQSDDKIFEKDGTRVVVDDVSLSMMQGSTVDFVDELIGSRFQVISNPNMQGGCSCGVSFNVG